MNILPLELEVSTEQEESAKVHVFSFLPIDSGGVIYQRTQTRTPQRYAPRHLKRRLRAQHRLALEVTKARLQGENIRVASH